MHLDALRGGVVAHDVLELAKVEVGVQLAVDTGQKIQVESRSDARWIVIRRQKLLDGLNHIRAEQQRISRLQALPDGGKKVDRSLGLEIANITAKKQGQQGLTVGPPLGNVVQTVQIK